MKKFQILSLKFFIMFLAMLFVFNSCKKVSSYSENCPKKEVIQKNLDNIQPGIIIEKIEKSPIPELCEVIIKISETQKGIFYVDSKGKYIISGNILEFNSLKNLTQEKLQLINKRFLTKEQISKLDKITDIIYGNSKNIIYFITDPDCPHCKKSEIILDQLVKENKLTIKVILFPIEALHPDAKQKAISLICDKKGFKELMEGYKSSNQCEVGKKKVDQNINFLFNELKINATPTFIFPDGEVKTGVLNENYIMSKY